MKTLAIIQARMGSTRLPNKVLLDLNGKSVLERVIERVQKSDYIDEVIVATTIAKHDLAIVKLCAEKNIRVFCGSEDDVLDRYYQCAKLLSPDYVIRITADCPLIDSEIIDLVISTHLNSGSDYTSNTLHPTYPDGLDVEIMKFSVLEEAWMKAILASQREHVTQYIIHNDAYVKSSVVNDIDYGNERWTLDTENDYRFIKCVYDNLYVKNPEFRMKNVLDILNEHPDFRSINNDSSRNEGLIKSLKNDKVVDVKNHTMKMS
ncbi:MAG: glycosyltransferase family protein [Acholeplasmataceae bacterium]|nr:glycosyltransferase family protein [Acholeplasmataceae bacterium]